MGGRSWGSGGASQKTEQRAPNGGDVREDGGSGQVVGVEVHPEGHRDTKGFYRRQERAGLEGP